MKNQLVTIAQAVIGKLQRWPDEEGQARESRNWYEFPKAAWGEIRCQIDERTHELSAYIDQDVGRRLRVTCDISGWMLEIHLRGLTSGNKI